MREIVPFWGMALAGLIVSTGLVHVVSSWNDAAWAVSAANLSAFAALWAFKYVTLDRLLFGSPAENPPVPVTG